MGLFTLRAFSQDKRGRECLAQYILRSPFSQEKMTYREDTKTVLYRSKMNPVSKKNFAIFPVLEWIATLTAHIPNKGEQLVRYYGYYSNVSRGKRKKLKPEGEKSWRPEGVEVTLHQFQRSYFLPDQDNSSSRSSRERLRITLLSAVMMASARSRFVCCSSSTFSSTVSRAMSR